MTATSTINKEQNNLSNDMAQQNLKEPEQVDWDTAFAGSKYAPPPPALGADGKAIVYRGTVVEAKQSDADEGYLNYQIDLKFVAPEGARVRTWASTRPFMRKNRDTGELEPVKGNPNKLASFLRGAGLQAKPQTNSEYVASVKAVNGKAIPFTIDWEARSKDTGEVVRGYLSFPEDPERPGQRKSILKRGDVVNEVDNRGNITGTKIVQSEVLFANARLKYFQDPTPKVGR